MEYLLLGFLTGLSLILAIGAQNIFVIEQGLKKQYVFLVCLVCSISDLILIFLGIFIFELFNKYFNSNVELVFNVALVIFLLHFIYSKIKLDNRHTDVILLEDGRSKRRLFSNWAMRDDPVKDWMWTKEEVADGAIKQLSEGDAMKIFVQHSREVDQFLS